jgi:hypothetical protein
MVSMADNQVDRVALAICNAERKAKCLTMAASLSEVLGEHHYRELARVAIAAMPDPTEAREPAYKCFPIPILFIGGYRRDAHRAAASAGLGTTQWQHCTRVEHIQGRSIGTIVKLAACGEKLLHEAVAASARSNRMKLTNEDHFIHSCNRNNKEKLID